MGLVNRISFDSCVVKQVQFGELSSWINLVHIVRQEEVPLTTSFQISRKFRINQLGFYKL